MLIKSTNILILFMLLCGQTIQAQTTPSGTLRGYIKDSQNQETLIGANVYLEALGRGAAADIEGFFTMKVPAGTYKLRITNVGYKTKFVENITVEADKVTELTLFADNESTALTEVKVVGSRMTNTEVSVISEIKASQQVVTGIAAAQIARSLDRDAAQVVKRVPGVTIQGERFINVRGLNQRYNNVMLHNAFTPSMETDVKAFSFDIIPSGQIDRLLVYKSPSADLPGEFAGGLIKIFTKSIPDASSLSFEYGTAFRAGTTFNTFKQAKTGPNYWTGFNNGYYELPTFFPKSINDIAGNKAAIESAGNSLRNEWVPQAYSAMPDSRYSITGSHKFELGKMTLGNVTALNYSDSRTIFDIDRNDFNANINNTTSPIYRFEDTQNSRSIRVGVIHNWGLRINENHKVEFKNLFNQQSNANYTQRGGRAIEANYNPDNHSFNQVYRGIYSGQLTGQHSLSERIKADWVIGYNSANRDQPDYRRYRSDVDLVQGDITNRSLYVPVGTAQAFFLGRWFSTMKESGKTASVNFSAKLGKSEDLNTELKAGIFWEQKDRDFNGRNLGYVRGSGFDASLFSANITQLFQNINSTTGIRIDEQTNPNDSYTASNSLLAYYALANVPLNKKFNAVVGVRAEDNTQLLNSAFIGGTKVAVRNPVFSVLPSVNLTYNFSEKSLLRAAFGQSINRPEFRELAPFSFYDFDFNVVYEGFTGLKVSNANNYDLKWEFYPSPSELISIGAFHKDFSNPIEIEVEPGSGSLGAKTFVYKNAASATNDGIEIEIRKSLSNIASPILNKMSVVLNTALIRSRVNLQNGTGQSNNRPLQGQSPYVINLGLNYNDSRHGLQLNANYNVIGKRIFAVGFVGYPDLYEMPRHQVDFSVSKEFKKKFTLKAGVQDILNQFNMILQDGNQDGKFDRVKDEIMQSYRPGAYYSLGLTYHLFR